MGRVYEPEDALQVLEARDREEYPVMTAPEVADRMGASRPTAVDRLSELVDRGDVTEVQFGDLRAYHLAAEKLTVDALDDEISTPGEAEPTADGGVNMDVKAVADRLPLPVRGTQEVAAIRRLVKFGLIGFGLCALAAAIIVGGGLLAGAGVLPTEMPDFLLYFVLVSLVGGVIALLLALSEYLFVRIGWYSPTPSDLADPETS